QRRRVYGALSRLRLLPSPPRRSSDLVGEQLPLLPRARGVRRVQVLRHRPREPPDDARPLPADQEPPGQLLGGQARLLLSLPRPRSEEHTSELQSRFDLVCHPLLDKKI